MTDLPFIPPAKLLIGDEEREAVDRVLRSGMLAQGPEVAAFEKEYSEHFRVTTVDQSFQHPRWREVVSCSAGEPLA